MFLTLSDWSRVGYCSTFLSEFAFRCIVVKIYLAAFQIMVGYIQVSRSMGIARSKYLFRRALEKDMDFGTSPAVFKNLSIEKGVNHMRSFLSSNLVIVRPYICSWLFGGPSLSTEWQSRFSRSQGTCSTFFNFRVLSPSQVLFFFFSKPTRILLQTTSCLSHPRK